MPESFIGKSRYKPFVKLFLDELVVYSVTCMDGYSVMDFIENFSL